MNQHYTSSRKSNIFPIRLLLVLAMIVMGLQGLKAQTANGYVIYYNGYYLAHNTSGALTTTATTTFNPETCLWTISGSYIRPVSSNGSTVLGNYYLRPRSNRNNYSLNTSTTNNYNTWNDASSGSQPYYNGYYIRLNNNTWQVSTTNSNRAYIYQVTKTPVAANTTVTVPTINPLSAELNLNGSQQFTATATATTTPDYDTYSFNSNAVTVYYFNGTAYTSVANMQASSDWTSATAAPTISYSWSLTGAANDYLTLTNGTSNPATVSYTSLSNANASSTLSVTATATANGDSDSKTSSSNATISVLPPENPNSISITTTSPVTIHVGTSGTVSYAFDPVGAYDNVTGTSSNSNVFTVGTLGGGIAVINPVGVGSATLTLTAHKLNGDAITPSATITVNVRNKVVTPNISFEQIGDGATANTTITCGTQGATIYYKIDDAASWSTFTGSFVVDEYQEVYAYAVMTGNDAQWWDDSDVAHETYVSCSTANPVISYTSSNGTTTVTITAETEANIYYTYGANPNAPTTSVYDGTGTTSVTFSGPTNGQVVKAIAKNSTCATSGTVTDTIVVSGVSGGVVTINDRESHSWSYYSDASLPANLHSLSPADVKITYYGDGIMMTGNNDYTASSTDTILSTNNDYKVGAKVNVGGEDENTFVYYKTLERAAATNTTWTFSSGNQSSAASRCPYTPIPNPFQVRPRYKDRGTTDANDFTGWRGFQCWRLKSVTGGAVYSTASGGNALSVGAVINAETAIYFAPNAEYGMEVQLEAVWARAYVKKANQANENPVGTNNVGYERNFCVPTTGAGYTLYTGDGKRITNANHIPVTISCYYPDGTAPDNTANSISNTATSLTGDTKFENILISLTSNTLTLANYDIIVGRGCGTSTINNLQGINGNATDLDYTIRLESGTYNQFCFIRNGGATVSGRYLVKAIMGSDYDRASGTNNKLSVSPNSTLFFAQGAGFTGSSNKDQKTFDCVFKSGRYQSEQWNGSIQSGQNGYQHIAYLGQNSAQGNTYPGVRYVTVEGGEFSGMCGGRGVGTNSVNAMTPEVITFDLRIKGGTFHGAVYGGAADNPSIGSRRFIITGGEIQSWIAGGCNGTGSTSGTGATDGDSYIYVGGTTLVGGDNPIVINETNGGQVFGAGRGISGRASSVNHSHVAIADEAIVANNNNNSTYPDGGNVYGGSYNGTIGEESNVYILGGRVEGSVFGGSYGNGTTGAIPTANITMTGGLVADGVFGGSNNTGTVNIVTMHIDGGQVGVGAGTNETANVHGGGLGQNTVIAQNVDLYVGSRNETTGETSGNAVVYGDVYGGSALGSVNGTTPTTTYHTNVTLNKGTIHGSLYGGALGQKNGVNGATSDIAANVYGPVQVKVYGGSVRNTDGSGANGSGGVYGANNINGAPQRSVTVDVYGTDEAPADDEYALFAVYGGGNAAAYTYGNGYPQVTVHNCDNSIEYVYGGGNAAAVASTDVKIYGGNTIGTVFGGGNGRVQAADVNGDAEANIYGGTIGQVFGGSNSQGAISGSITVNVNKQGDTDTNGSSTACPMKIGEVYGGGNEAASQAGGITIGCTGDLVTGADGHEAHPENIGTTLEGIGAVYGGANAAQVTGNITLNITSGMIYRVFGGNNTSNTVNGTITVNINKDNSTCGWYVGYVYGGGNNAPYTRANQSFPKVNLMAGKVSRDVFGAGKGSTAVVTGNPVVTLTGSSEVGGNVYGGGDQGAVNGETKVEIKDAN